jgi:hypothetical protein
MKARTSVLIILIAAIFVLGSVSHGYAAQTAQNQSGNNPNYNSAGSQAGQTNMTNDPGAQGETPGSSNPMQPVIIRHVGWSWLLISGLIGFVLGRATSIRRRPYGRDEDIRRNRAA